MKKIVYPSNAAALAKFENDYYNCLDQSNIAALNRHLQNINLPSGGVLTFESLVGSSLKNLIALKPQLKDYAASLTDPVREYFLKLFDYKRNQPEIARFFMVETNFNFKVCHYCGIDYVNAFTDLNDYFDELDFLNRAGLKDLMTISGIGRKRADAILALKLNDPILKVEQINLGPKIHDAVKNFAGHNSHNHFTLDHVIPQKTHKFFSLCLYNFVPSCYGCNSKFKKANEFVIDADLLKISPTSDAYSFGDDFKFRLYYTRELKDIKTNADFVLYNSISNNNAHISNYLEMFKINGRYRFHKDLVLNLIRKKVKYPDSEITKLARKKGISSDELRREIFGEELFDPLEPDSPFIKLKKDAAIQLKIIK